jgi:hypothetical protein
MKKVIRRLVVRRETLRALRALDNRELGRAVGAESNACPDRLFETDNINCPVRGGAQTGSAYCPA